MSSSDLPFPLADTPRHLVTAVAIAVPAGLVGVAVVVGSIIAYYCIIARRRRRLAQAEDSAKVPLYRPLGLSPSLPTPPTPGFRQSPPLPPILSITSR